MSNSPPLRLAVIGAAHPHVMYALAELAHRDDVVLVGVSDPDPALAHRHAHGAPTYTDHRSLLAQQHPNVVVAAGIYSERAIAIIDALHAGCDVLADKPLCTDLADLFAIEAAAASSGRHVCMMLEKRYYPETLAARRLLAEGLLGELVMVSATGPHKQNRSSRPDWFLRRTTYGGIIGDLAVHDIDLTLQLSGAVEGTVSAVGDSGRFGAVLLRAGPIAATIDVSWLTPTAAPWHGDYRMVLTGTDGTAELLWTQGCLIATTNDRPRWKVDLPGGMRPAVEALDAFVAGREPGVTTSASVTATRIALLAQDSADNGGITHTWKAGGH